MLVNNAGALVLRVSLPLDHLFVYIFICYSFGNIVISINVLGNTPNLPLNNLTGHMYYINLNIDMESMSKTKTPCFRKVLMLGGERGIRTLGELPHTAFRERPVQPLLHLSSLALF